MKFVYPPHHVYFPHQFLQFHRQCIVENYGHLSAKCHVYVARARVIILEDHNRNMSLFECCVTTLFKSTELLRKASMYLPKALAQYILFEACRSRNYAAIEAIVKAWSYPELSFDFMSNSFCRRKEELSELCIEPHSYYNIYSSNKYEDCISSIALGLFNQLYTCLESNKDSNIEVANLSKIRVTSPSKGTLLGR